MLSNLFQIGGKLYMSDFREDDLQRFYKDAVNFKDLPTAERINAGARNLFVSNMALVALEPKELSFAD